MTARAAGVLFLLLLAASPAAQCASPSAKEKEKELRELRGRIDALQKSLAAAEERGLFSLLEVTLPPTTAAVVAAERRRLGLPVAGPTGPAPDMLRELVSARYVVVQSRFSAASVMAHGVEPGRVFLMPLGVDAERFRPAAARTAASTMPALRMPQMTPSMA